MVGGTCDTSEVSVCPGNFTKVLDTQIISKSLPALNLYPVRVYVNVSYSVTCPEESKCDNDLELQLIEYRGMQATGNTADLSESFLDSAVRTVSFTARPKEFNRFVLSIVGHPSDSCISVTRVLVYRHECPSRQSAGGLGLLPATQAPINDSSVPVVPQCVRNAHLSEMDTTEVGCAPSGMWMNDETLCVCDEEYLNNSGRCRGIQCHY